MLSERPTYVQVSDETLSNIRRLRDILNGAAALMQPGAGARDVAIHAARGSLLEAQAVASILVDTMERAAAVQAEQERSAHAGAVKSVGLDTGVQR